MMFIAILQISTVMILLTNGIPISNMETPTSFPNGQTWKPYLSFPASRGSVDKRSDNEDNRRALNVNVHLAAPSPETVSEQDGTMFNVKAKANDDSDGSTSRPEILDAFVKELTHFLENDKEPDESQNNSHVSGLRHEVSDALGEEFSNNLHETSYGESFASNGDRHLCDECFQQEQVHNLLLSLEPAYPCDDWDSKSRTCFLDRNIGGTVTFKLQFENTKKTIPQVIWKQEFHILHKSRRTAHVIQPEETMWNIVIGSKGYEFRVSPITEMDMDSNAFSASLHESEEHQDTHGKKIYFRIRPIPIDLGFVYPGETLFLNMDSFISLPFESMQYLWYMEEDGESRTLPSNMKKSFSGNALTISELRKEQEGVVACSVYTNLGFLVAKKRFLVKEIRENEVLMLPSNQNLQAQKIISSLQPNYHLPLRRSYRKIKVEEQIEQRLQEVEDSKSRVEDSNEGFEVRNEEDYPLIKKNAYKNQNGYSSGSNSGLQNESIGDLSRQLPPPASKIIADKVFEQLESDQNERMVQQISSTTQKDSGVSFNTFYKKQPVFPVSTEQNYLIPQKSGEHFPPSSIASNPGTNSNIVLQIEDARPEDKLSKLIAECYRARQCSGHAACMLQNDRQEAGFCRCLSNYHGNGISCWENMNSRS